MERICVTGIESAYGRKKVLRGVDLSAEAGQCVGIVGANGCGKSTLLNILAGLRRADKGMIAFDGVVADCITQERQRPPKGSEQLFIRYTGYVPQENTLIPELSVRDNLLLWYGDGEVLERELAEGFLHLLGLAEMCSQKVGKLSGGMKKKVSIGCALAGNPPVLLLDEPGAALDLPGKAKVREHLQRYKGMGGTVLLATHEETELDICDKLYALKEGRCREIDAGLRGDALLSQIL
ncbi:MAG: ABC transporter ATP-binding protein [Lachnospiraceae bacterium]|nr:ABC transporter ATP-binding protein [Lachnospiraceae bacterium]